MRPRLFIASSSESLETANAVQQELERDAEVTVWTQDVFLPSRVVIDALIEAAGKFDFGVFVFSPDDLIRIRGATQAAVRDNVVYELGLFTGRLGRERSFILRPRQPRDVRLPTDLVGVIPLEYDAEREDGNVRAAVGPPCSELRRVIRSLGRFSAEEATVLNDPVYKDHPAEVSNSVIAGLWLSRFEFRAKRKRGFVSGVQYDVELLVPGGQRSLAGHNLLCSTSGTTEFWHELRVLIVKDYILGRWFNVNSQNFGAFQLYVHSDHHLMIGQHLGNANDNSVQEGEWAWLRIVETFPSRQRIAEIKALTMHPVNNLDEVFGSWTDKAKPVSLDQIALRRA